MNDILAEYGRILLSRWRWLVWGVLVALALTVTSLFIEPPTYRSSALVLVRTPGDVSQVSDGGDSYAQQRAKTYAALANSRILSSGAIAHLGYSIEPDTLSGRISATNRPGTALMDFSVTAPSANEARLTANVVLAEYADMVRGLETVPGSVVPRAEIVVVDGPGTASRALAWGLPLPLLITGAAFVGLFLAACAAVLQETFGRTHNPRIGSHKFQRRDDDVSPASAPFKFADSDSRHEQLGGRRRRR